MTRRTPADYKPQDDLKVWEGFGRAIGALTDNDMGMPIRFYIYKRWIAPNKPDPTVVPPTRHTHDPSCYCGYCPLDNPDAQESPGPTPHSPPADGDAQRQPQRGVAMTGRQVAQMAGIALAVYLAIEFLRSGDPRAQALRGRASG